MQFAIFFLPLLNFSTFTQTKRFLLKRPILKFLTKFVKKDLKGKLK